MLWSYTNMRMMYQQKKRKSWIENGNQINRTSMSADINTDVAWSWWRIINEASEWVFDIQVSWSLSTSYYLIAITFKKAITIKLSSFYYYLTFSLYVNTHQEHQFLVSFIETHELHHRTLASFVFFWKSYILLNI